MQVKSEEKAQYNVNVVSEEKVINEALKILQKRMKKRDNFFTNPNDTKNFLQLKFQGLESEVFSALLLDNRHRLIEYKEFFQGTINGASVHPREIVKYTLKVNAAAVILAHNHPSGVSEPSEADKVLTRRLADILQVVDIRVLDHIVIGDNELTSFAERGLI